jgi:hypothetical protein
MQVTSLARRIKKEFLPQSSSRGQHIDEADQQPRHAQQLYRQTAVCSDVCVQRWQLFLQ